MKLFSRKAPLAVATATAVTPGAMTAPTAMAEQSSAAATTPAGGAAGRRCATPGRDAVSREPSMRPPAPSAPSVGAPSRALVSATSYRGSDISGA